MNFVWIISFLLQLQIILYCFGVPFTLDDLICWLCNITETNFFFVVVLRALVGVHITTLLACHLIPNFETRQIINSQASKTKTYHQFAAHIWWSYKYERVTNTRIHILCVYIDIRHNGEQDEKRHTITLKQQEMQKFFSIREKHKKKWTNNYNKH